MAVTPVPCADCGGAGPEADIVNTPVSTGIRRFIGTMGPFDLVALLPGLQSVTLTVLAGEVLVNTSNGVGQPVPPGVSLTWSVSDTDDASLSAAIFNGTSTEVDYILAFTYKGTAAG